MNDFSKINSEYPIIEAAKALGLEGDYRLHERSPEDLRCKSVFNPGDGDDVTSIDSVKNNWYDHKELRGSGVLELWALVRYGSCDDLECKKKAAQDINDLAGGIFSKGSKNSPAPNIKANSKAMRLKSDFRSNVDKWHDLLMSDNPDAVKACEYLHSRKINDDTIRRFKLLVKQEFSGLKYYRLQRVKKSSMKGFAEIAISEGHGKVKEAIKETGPSQARQIAGMEVQA